MRGKAVLSQTGDRCEKRLLLPEMADESYPKDGGFRPNLMFVLAVREDEAEALERGEEIEIKTLDELRAEFLKNHGEIYEY